MVTIIIPTYNGEKVLTRYALSSLQRQTFSDWEALIINDGSNDNTNKIVEEITNYNNRIRLINLPTNLGLAAALNRGVNEARGEYIFILEHDDIWLPEKLEQQVKILETGAFICTTNAIVWNTNKKNFVKINGGNFSCLSFRKDKSDILFPLPEVNKKYLGIEDGIITAELELAKTNKTLNKDNLVHIDEILTIMNSNESTLSGKKDCLIMMKRYDNVIKLYTEKQKKHPELKKLMIFWKKHRLYNSILSLLPKFLKKIIYLLVAKIKNIKNGPMTVYLKLPKPELEKLTEYRKYFD